MKKTKRDKKQKRQQKGTVAGCMNSVRMNSGGQEQIPQRTHQIIQVCNTFDQV